jgi:myo-inositol catabolism protein IolS
VTTNARLPRVQLAQSEERLLPLGMGGSFYGLDHGQRQGEADILAALEAALEVGITHFDTATDYGQGYSERLFGRFINAESDRRERVFLASKANLNDTSARAVTDAIDASLARLRTDAIDLYYLHWPRTGQDMRAWMEGLEAARSQGKIRAIGVSNFSVAQMEHISEVGRIDVYQLGYNLLWRFGEADVVPYCAEHDIDIVVYSALAHGILSGKYAQQLEFAPEDQRWTITLFRGDVWPHVYDAVEAMKEVAARANLSLSHLALRWLLRQRGVNTVLVSAKNRQQVLANAQALEVEVPDDVVDELTRLSDRAMQSVPNEGNPFGYHP